MEGVSPKTVKDRKTAISGYSIWGEDESRAALPSSRIMISARCMDRSSCGVPVSAPTLLRFSNSRFPSPKLSSIDFFLVGPLSTSDVTARLERKSEGRRKSLQASIILAIASALKGSALTISVSLSKLSNIAGDSSGSESIVYMLFRTEQSPS